MARKQSARSKEVCDVFLETGNASEAARAVGITHQGANSILSSGVGKTYVESVRGAAKVDIRVASRNERLAILSEIARGTAGEAPVDRIGACRLISQMQGELVAKAEVKVGALDFASMPLAQVIRIARGDMSALPDPEQFDDDTH